MSLAIEELKQHWQTQRQLGPFSMTSYIASPGDAAPEPLPLSLALALLAAYRMGQGPSSTPPPSTFPS
jgi:hypothetical protein